MWTPISHQMQHRNLFTIFDQTLPIISAFSPSTYWEMETMLAQRQTQNTPLKKSTKPIDYGRKKEWHPYISSKPRLTIQIFIALSYFIKLYHPTIFTLSPYFRISIIVITVIIVTFAILGLGISLVVFRSCSCGKSSGLRHDGITCEVTEDEEAMELVPHITLNPSFNIDMLEYLEAEESPTSDLQYPPSLNMSSAARAGTSAALRAAASKAVTNVASVAPSGSNGIRKGSSLTEDQVNLVTIGQM